MDIKKLTDRELLEALYTLLESLPDVMIEAHIKAQKELDNDFYAKASALNQGWEMTSTIYDQNAIDAEYDEILTRLEADLQDAVDHDNYETASMLRDQIKQLKESRK